MLVFDVVPDQLLHGDMPEATVLALQSFDEPIVLLVGGYDKQIDLSAIAATAVSRCRAVALLGQTGPQLGKLIEQAARAANITPTDVIRLCVKHGLPIVRAGFEEMERLSKQRGGAKGKASAA